jgi:cytochrome c2
MFCRAILIATCFALYACARNSAYEPQAPGGDAQRGRMALEQYECGVCHVIPGVRGARGSVGPPLAAYGANVYVAGKYPNTPEFLVRWIMDPPELAPETAMPALGVTEDQAHDIAAYLYTLR